MSVELLSPAGNLEKLKFATYYGADAVYFSYKDYGLRNKANNFSFDEIKYAINFLHERGKKGYITLNIYAKNNDLRSIETFIEKIASFNIDAFIVSDPGIIYLIKKMNVNIPLHLSTQANTTNINAVKFWEDLGIKRIILARELPLKEIEFICNNTNLEIEVFVHGAMCISYSGRCYLSQYLTGKDANRGECTHPCRWKYYLVEEERANDYYEVDFDERGSYILNSKDLCLIDYIDKLINAGVKSFKIEGRMKSLYYVSIVTGVYRKAIDNYYDNKFSLIKSYKDLLELVSNRGYTNAFIDGYNNKTTNNVSSKYVRKGDFIGYFINKDGKYILISRAKAEVGEKLKVFTPNLYKFNLILKDIYSLKDGNKVEFLKPNEEYVIDTPKDIEEYSLLVRDR
ncbi:MAG: U32 family peptidase C-terminal domain-containing protein [Deferribacterota bacterium]|nr:U32 family peptidase C-terminal domain-containing protein [Deferribacterota bacterium]